MIAAAPDKTKVSPLAYYYLGFFAEKQGQDEKAMEYYRLGCKMPPDFVFPFQAEAIAVLRRAMEVNPGDARPLLPRQPAVRLAARGGHQTLGKIGLVGRRHAHRAPEPGNRIFAPG